MAKATKGNNAQFTYDFGIAIAQSTINKITRLTGATLTLASAFYALKTTAAQYVDILKENTLRFGGVLSTMKAMEQAQNRLIKGQSYFSVDDQLKGMNRLMSVGINVGKELDWINKAAHATGKSYSEFSGMIASAISGNSQALVDAGLMTQRATRMFDKYQANTIMRQRAILNFVKNHKGLMDAIKNDFETIQDQTLRMKATWSSFLKSIVGKPNDPNSFYGQIVYSMKMVATSLAANAEKMKKYGYMIGQVLGWVIRQIGYFVVWVGRQVKKVIESVWKVTDDYQTQTRSILVWLEFWKLKVVDFFKEYGGAIKTILKLLIMYKALKTVFVISNLAIASVIRYRNALASMFLLQKKYLVFMGPAIGNKFTRWLQSLAVFMPRKLRRMWVAVGKGIERFFFGGGLKKIFTSFFGLKPLFKFLGKSIKFIFGLIRNLPAIFMALVKAGKALYAALLGSNPVGWIILAITLLGTLYAKSKKFRIFINNFFKGVWEALKMVYNFIVGIFVYALVGIKKAWVWFKEYIWKPVANFFKSAWTWIGDMWDRFKDTSIGRFIDKWIVSPIKKVFEWIVSAWQWVMKGMAKIVTFLAGANSEMAKSINSVAQGHGLPQIAVGGGNYDTSDDTNYINPNNWGLPKDPEVPENTPTANPLIPNSNTTPIIKTTPTTNSNSMTFENGAVQIVVQKGDGIDENKLARKIKDVIMDMKREQETRGGY